MKGLSLFANIGIGETYLKDLGIDIVLANELLPLRCQIYAQQHPYAQVIEGDINDNKIFKEIKNKAIKEKVDFIMATPPCQGMSVAGKSDPNDERNKLILSVIKMVKAIEPKYVLIENVPKFLKTKISYKKDSLLIPEIIYKELSKKYNITMKVMDASDYGTAQYRERAIVLLTKKPLKPWVFPEKENKITVRDVIGHLPSLESGMDSGIKYHKAKEHNDKHILWMKNTPSGKTAFENPVYYPQKDDGTKITGFATTYKRMDWDRPAPTITMGNGAISSQNNVHPGRLNLDGTYSDARALTILELILLSGLPKDWTYPEFVSENQIRQVIGEQVPPLLIKKLCEQIVKKKNS